MNADQLNLIGLCLWRRVRLMKTKYNFDFNEDVVSVDKKRLINQCWKLIPMKENNENWQMHLKILIEEIAGLSEIYFNKVDYLILLSKLEGLNSAVCEDFNIYRKTVFRCIDLLSKVM